MKQFIVITLLASAVFSASGQNSVDEVLRSIEANNKELQANKAACRFPKTGSQAG